MQARFEASKAKAAIDNFRTVTTGRIRSYVDDMEAITVPEIDHTIELMKKGPKNYWGYSPNDVQTTITDYYYIDKVLRDLARWHKKTYENKVAKYVARHPSPWDNDFK